jgi:hypothetical protein
MVSEQAVSVSADQNLVVVRSEEHSWLALLRGGVQISRESSGEPVAGFIVEPGEYVLQTDGQVTSIELGYQELPPRPGTANIAELRLSSDAPDVHEVDGVGEIPADGTSTATVTVEKLDGQGGRVAEADEEIFLRSTGGALLAADSDTRIRSVRLDSGAAAFRLQAESSPKLVTVFAFSQSRTLTTELALEFV